MDLGLLIIVISIMYPDSPILIIKAPIFGFRALERFL